MMRFRAPDELKAWIESHAKEERRSVNATLVDLLNMARAVIEADKMKKDSEATKKEYEAFKMAEEALRIAKEARSLWQDSALTRGINKTKSD